MSGRLARTADAATFRDVILGFFQDIGREAPTLTIQKVRERQRQATTVAALDDANGTMAEFQLQRDGIEAILLFPRGTPMSDFDGVLRVAAVEMRRRWPQALDWYVWGRFLFGVDDQGVPDGGESESRAWQRHLGPNLEVVRDERGWMARIRLRDLMP